MSWWPCPRCSLQNSPVSHHCKNCDRPKPSEYCEDNFGRAPSLADAVKRVLVSLQCPVCFEVFNDETSHVPCTLPCGHSLCMEHVRECSHCPLCAQKISRSQLSNFGKSTSLCEAARAASILKNMVLGANSELPRGASSFERSTPSLTQTHVPVAVAVAVAVETDHSQITGQLAQQEERHMEFHNRRFSTGSSVPTSARRQTSEENSSGSRRRSSMDHNPTSRSDRNVENTTTWRRSSADHQTRSPKQATPKERHQQQKQEKQQKQQQQQQNPQQQRSNKMAPSMFRRLSGEKGAMQQFLNASSSSSLPKSLTPSPNGTKQTKLRRGSSDGGKPVSTNAVMKSCGHKCELDNSRCCSHNDNRQKDSSYARYDPTLGWVFDAKRYDTYCRTCKDRCRQQERAKTNMLKDGPQMQRKACSIVN